jgi:malate dehydrogenase (oxaloacetate-decarboxylating)
LLFNDKNLRELTAKEHVYSKTSKVAVIVSDGTAILGLGNIGPRAGLPVMEGKSLLFKFLGGVDVIPFCINRYPNAQH